RLRPHRFARPSCLVAHTTSGPSIIHKQLTVEGGPRCGHEREPPQARRWCVPGSGHVQIRQGKRKYGTPIDRTEMRCRCFLAETDIQCLAIVVRSYELRRRLYYRYACAT